MHFHSFSSINILHIRYTCLIHITLPYFANGTIRYIYTIPKFTTARSAEYKQTNYYRVGQIVENTGSSNSLGDLLILGVHCNTLHRHAFGKSRGTVLTNHSEWLGTW